MKLFLLTLCTFSLVLFFNLKIFSQSNFKVSADLEDFWYYEVSKAANKDILFLASKRDNINLLVSRWQPGSKKVWSKEIITSGINLQHYKSFYATGDNGFLILEGHSEYLNSTYLNTIKVMRFDSSGNNLWNKSLDITEAGSQYINVKITESADGSIFLAALDIYKFLKVFKLTDSGNIIWHKRFGTSTSLWNQLGAIAAGENGDLVITIQKVSCEGFCSNAYIHKLDKDGNTEWGGNLGLSNYSNFPMNAMLKNGKIYLLLYSQPTSITSKFSFVTMDANSSNANGYYIDFNVFALRKFFMKYKVNLAKNQMLANYNNSDWIMLDDWSLLQIVYPDYPNILPLLKFDTENRICPDMLPVAVNSTYEKLSVTVGNSPYTASQNIFTESTFNVEVKDKAINLDIQCYTPMPANDK